MPHPLPPTPIDRHAAARWQALGPCGYGSPWLHEEVARRMEERLQWIKTQPRRWVHWAALQGGLQGQRRLEQRYTGSECFVLESSPQAALTAQKKMARPWWKPPSRKSTALRFASPSQPVDLVWANMAGHMAAEPQALIARWFGLLQTDGILMFSCLGPDTLRELRAVYAAQGWPPPAHDYTDMHHWGDALLAAGFADPVMDMERITLTFETPQRLLQELRELGRNLSPGRFAGLRARGWHTRLMDALQQNLAIPASEGRLGLTFEIIYGHAVKPAPRLAVGAHSSISLQQMRGALGLARTETPTED